MKEEIVSNSHPSHGNGEEKTPESRVTRAESYSDVTWTPEEEKALIKKYVNIELQILYINANNQPMLHRVDFIVMPMLMMVYLTFQLDRANM